MSKQGLEKGISGVVRGVVSGVVPGVVPGLVSSVVPGIVPVVVPGVVANSEPPERCQRIASSGCYKNAASDNLNSRNTRNGL